MKKRTYMMRLLSAGMCIVMVLALLGGCAAPAESPDDGHDHDTEDLDDVVLDDTGIPMGSYPNTTTDGHEHQWETHATENGYDCISGTSWIAYNECVLCGLRVNIAYRPKDGEGEPAVGHHDFEEHEIESECSGNKRVEKTCKKCGHTEITGTGKHVWGAWSEAVKTNNPSYCENGTTETRTCEKCGQSESRSVGGDGHRWITDKTTPATCTEPEKLEQRCRVCGMTRTTDGAPALNHNFGGNTDCTAERECTRCGVKVSGGQHSYGDYKKDATGHWRVCTVCQVRTETERHTDDGTGFCSVCDYKMVADAKPGQCIHNWVYNTDTNDKDENNKPKYGRFGAGYHWVKCTKCGEITSVSCQTWGKTQPRQYCTDPTYCECGNVVKEGQKRHNLPSSYVQTADKHSIACRNIGCQYKVEEPHQYTATITDCTAGRKCTVCGYVSKAASYTQHEWGPWTDNGGGAHTRRCTHPGCTVTESAAHVVSGNVDDCTKNLTCSVCSAVVVSGSSQHIWGAPTSAGEGGHNRHCLHPGCSAVQNSAHTGGTATCTSAAQCTECGGYYGSKNPNNHSGGTEIRDAVPATVGKAGYTGDTYCVGCGQKIASGQTIEALKEDHSHAYGAQWVSDDTGHWHVCTCGEKGSFAVHDYKDGKCFVCEAADPNYVEHVHTYTETWSADSHNHWHVCTGCGEKADVTEHVIVTTDDGSTHCLTCGMTLEDYKAKVEEETGKAPGTQPEDQPGETEPGTEPGGTQSPEQPPVEEHPSEQFKDVSANETEVAAIDFVVGSGLMAGTDTVNGKFTPYGTTTRGQVMTILAKMSGVDTYDPDDWQRKGIEWATSNGLTEDTDGNAAMKRSELIYMLWKATGSQAADLSVLDAYSDAGQLTGEYRQAMAWAVQYLGMRGNGTELMLDATTTRVQLAIILNSADSKGLLG